MSDEKHEMTRTESTPPSRTPREAQTVAPYYDLSETESEFTLTLETPGISKDALEIRADRETLSIRGKRQEETEGLSPIFRERSKAEFYREFTMDDTVDWEKITASVQDGIVTIQIPKAAHAQPRRIKIS